MNDYESTLAQRSYRIQKLLHSSPTTILFVVAKGSNSFVAKFPQTGQEKYEAQFLRRENRALQVAGNFRGIPREEEFYDNLHQTFLVREYIEGETLSDSQTPTTKQIDSLTNIVHYFHNIGITGLDIRRANIIAHKGLAYLIDFDTALFLDEMPRHDWCWNAMQDLHDLAELN